VKLRLFGTMLGGLVLLALWIVARRDGERGGVGERASGPAHTAVPRARLEPAPAAARAAVAPEGAASARATPAPGGARLFGTFTDAGDGRPLGALALGVQGAATERRTRTARDGSFAFELAPGAWTFFLRPPQGRVAFVQELVLAAGEERELSRALGTAQSLCVRVWRVERGDVVPCADADVWLIQGDDDRLARARWPDVAGLAAVRTDREGRVELPCEDFAKVLLLVERAGYLPYAAAFDFNPVLSWSAFSPDGCIHLALAELGASVRGRVLDPAGRPLEGALVAVIDCAEPAYALEDLGRVPAHVDGLALQPGEHPALTHTTNDGEFTLEIPRALAERGSGATLLVLSGRAELVHHATRALDAAELLGKRAVELTLPAAGPVELEFVDQHGATRDGVASVRDPDGFAHGGTDAPTIVDLLARGAGRRFQTSAGRVQLLHPGGRVRVGLSPGGLWDGREFELKIPAGQELRRLRVVVPR
jgi:hypothetical protein